MDIANFIEFIQDNSLNIAGGVSLVAALASIVLLAVTLKSIKTSEKNTRELLKVSLDINTESVLALKTENIKRMIRQLERDGAFSGISKNELTDDQIQEVTDRFVADVVEVVNEKYEDSDNISEVRVER